MRPTAQGWTLVHQKRAEWRGTYDGVFLGEHDGEWIAGLMHQGKSMHDGFGEDGEWRYANCYDSPSEHEANRALRAVREYIRLSKLAADCWNGIFDQRAGEAVDRHWANRVPLGDMSASWVHPGQTGDVRGSHYMLPAAESKYELLQYMRHSHTVSEAFRDVPQIRPGSELAKAYDAAIGAVGPVRLSVAGDHFSLSYSGNYNDADEHWGRSWHRKPHPDRNAGN
ncbi:hypothetical protein GCM10010306_103550 [Streptomyces umbrinus]|uniref:hypothetical protein n=1 Tax=Streptomyces umbrinus TaxID=67370 RepID=UPI00167423F7|nr:hypothetical protein [Streptomyces umbrinus]GHB91634.1 hypothetical protein GCM10010306_103550 [Streptomyces umbrinus]